MPQYQNLHKTGISIFLLINVFILNAQIKPDATIATPNATGTAGIPYKPADYTAGGLVNYVRVWQSQQATTDETYIISPSRTVDQVNISTQYFDGLGRPLQTVNWQTSPGKQDIVTPVVYDAYGREQYKFLPYTSPTISASGFPGQLKTNPFTEQSNFYTTTYITEQPALTNEKFFYSKTNFEASPLNRVANSFAPGNSWAGSEGGPAEKKVTMQYLVNTSADAVRIWHIDFNTTIADNTNIPYSNSADIYADGELYKTVTLDEAGNVVVEYKDKEGQVILKKVQIGTVPADFSGYTNFLCTYYVYDDLNQLRTVLQPKAVAAMASANNWVLAQTAVNQLCFRYEYDQRQRVIAKKVPGAGWVYMVYDIRDRLVFSQDANMGSKSPQQWMYTFYDDLNRPVQTGIMAYTVSQATLQSGMPTTSTASTITNSGTNQNTNPADMYINSRETGRTTYQATNSIVFDNGFASEDNASFTAQITTETASTFSNPVSVNTYYIPSGATLYPLTYTYYGDYSATSKTYNTVNNSKLDDGGNLYPETLPSTNSTQTKGMVTVTKVRVIEDPTNLTLGKWLETANFYDDKARVIQVQSTNYKGGNDIVTNRYDFTNKIVSSYITHNNVSGNVNNLRVLSSINYDHEGRLKTITKTINDDATNNKRVVVTNTYDALGQLKNKKTGQKSATDATTLEDDSYNYNIRGWLKDINWYNSGGGYASQMSVTSNKWFSMDLSYDWGFSTVSQYNGNISGTRWKTAGDGQERAYGFRYDAANRLLEGDFTQNNSGWITDPVVDFSMKMGDGLTASSAYDENGNILKMWQKGITGVTNSVIDNLTYSYFSTSNKLSAVSEATPVDNKLGDFTDNNTSGNDYGYDVNGNLITDLNKRMNGTTGIDQTSGGAITYNFLNLPWQLSVKNADGSSKGTITYIYDATGNKLEKRTIEAASTYNNNVSKQTTTSYLGGFVYENNVLQFLSHEEGRVRYKADNNTYVFDYFIKDHLGNVRMVLTEETPTNYYPATTLEGLNDGTSNSMVNYEKQFYNITSAYIVPETSIPSWAPETTANTKLYYNNNGNPPANLSYPAGCTPTQTDGSNNLYRLNATTNQTGLEFMIHVMAGDHIDIFGKSYYLNTAAITNTNSTTLDALTLLTNMLLSPANPAAGKGITGSQLNTLNSGLIPSSFFRGGNSEPATTVPKAYINYIFFDEQFKFAGGGASRVGTSGSVKDHWYADAQLQNILVPKNGYIFVYVSNESNLDVFFDNLQVIHKPGPLLEETHYYPFGLTMAGISSKAAGAITNRYKFNDATELQNKEFSDGSGLELYETDFRSIDPQIGRFLQQDPIGEYFEDKTSYAFANNNPILLNDPLGLAADDWVKKKDGLVVFDKKVTNQTQAEAKYGKEATDLGKETDLYDVKADATVHGNADGTTSPQQLAEVKITGKSSTSKSFNVHDAENGLKVVFNNYGKEMASNVERMYRLETNHFRSSQYIHTGTGGMEVHGPAPYYGWTPSYFTEPPIGIYSIYENKGLSGVGGNAQVTNRPKQFVIMPTVTSAMMFKANYIQGHDGNYARWFSTNPQAQALYRTKIQAITPKIVNGF